MYYYRVRDMYIEHGRVDPPRQPREEPNAQINALREVVHQNLQEDPIQSARALARHLG